MAAHSHFQPGTRVRDTFKGLTGIVLDDDDPRVAEERARIDTTLAGTRFDRPDWSDDRVPYRSDTGGVVWAGPHDLELLPAEQPPTEELSAWLAEWEAFADEEARREREEREEGKE